MSMSDTISDKEIIFRPKTIDQAMEAYEEYSLFAISPKEFQLNFAPEEAMEHGIYLERCEQQQHTLAQRDRKVKFYFWLIAPKWLMIYKQ